MRLTTTEMVYINEAAKASKQRFCILIGNVLVGLDNISNMISYIPLDSNFIDDYIDGWVFQSKNLSAFIKGLTVESEFNFNFGDTIKTISGAELLMSADIGNHNQACINLRKSMVISNNLLIPEEEISDVAQRLNTMTKADGSINITHHGYVMTVFSSILPISKADKLYVTLYAGSQPNIFTARYRIQKKKFNMMVFITYIKVN